MTDLLALFKKENLLVPKNEKERKTRTVYLAAFVAFFLLSALLMWTFVCNLCHMVGSIVSGSPNQAVSELLRMMPLFLLEWSCAGLGIAALSLGRTDRANIREKRVRTAGFVSLSIGAVVVLWVIVGWIAGEYERFVEGGILPLFPLDALLGGALLLLFGKAFLTYAQRLGKEKAPKSAEALPEKRDSVLFRVGRTAAYILAACGFSAVCLGIFTMDWTHGNLFYNFMLLLTYASPVCMLAAYRFVTTDLREDLRPAAQKKLSLLFLIANAVLLVLYLLAVELQNEAPNLNAFSILPIEFTASFNAYLFCYPVANLVSPLAALLSKKK